MGKVQTVREILRQEGYSSAEAFTQDAAYLMALAKVEQYRAECELYERKYGMELDSFRSERKVKGEEHFQEEDDLDDWMFADAALRWWEARSRELKNA